MFARIYKGKGVDAFSQKQLFLSLQVENLPVKEISASQLLQDNWEYDTRILIFPGGRDIPYHQALTGMANQRIRAFVENGGCYLGICAGAYYGCESILFEEGSPLEVRQTRELAFFPGEAFGPAYGTHTFQYRQAMGARLAHIHCPEIDGYFKPYFNGGCLFRLKEELSCESGVAILSTKSPLPNNSPAIVRCAVGQGFATLCGVHPEYCSKRIETNDPYIQKLIPALEEEEEGRRQLFAYLMHAALCVKA